MFSERIMEEFRSSNQNDDRCPVKLLKVRTYRNKGLLPLTDGCLLFAKLTILSSPDLHPFLRHFITIAFIYLALLFCNQIEHLLISLPMWFSFAYLKTKDKCRYKAYYQRSGAIFNSEVQLSLALLLSICL